MRDRHILSWLSKIATSPVDSNSRKRRYTHPLSPSMSDDDNTDCVDDNVAAKRQRLDPNATPKASSSTHRLAGRFNLPPDDADSNRLPDDISSTTTTGSKRARSRTSSPTKKMAALELDSIIKKETFDGIVPLPPELRPIASQLQRISEGQGIISIEDQEEIASHVDNVLDRQLFASLLDVPSAVDQSGSRRKFGTLPPVLDLVEILADAKDSFISDQPEAHWNCMVHSPLLLGGVRHSSSYRSAVSDSEAQCSVRVHNITNAQIASAFVPARDSVKHEKRVDFCLALEAYDDAKDKIRDAVRKTPHRSINHTEHIPLSTRPIAVSIETKRFDGSSAQALYQMSTWLSAHWIYLQSLLLNKGYCEGQEPSAQSQTHTRPPFLPGIIIEGHNWAFVAATLGKARKEGGWETVVWTGIDIGSTKSLRGIAQIVATLQILADWTVSTYWPWFKELISEAG